MLQISLLTALGMAYQVGLGMCMPLYARYAEQLELGEAAGGLVIATPCIARVLLNLFIGPLVDSLGRKPLLIGGCTVMALGAFRTASATTLCTMLIGRLLVGVGGAAKDIASNACRLDVVTRFPNHRGLLLGWAQALTTLAYAAGPVAGGRIAEHGDVREPFYAFAYILAVCAPFYGLLPETSSDRIATEENDDRSPTIAERHRDAKGRSPGGEPPLSTGWGALHGSGALQELLRDPRQRALLLLRFALTAGWAAWMTVLPSHLRHRFGLDTASVGLYLSALTVLGFAASPVGGWLADCCGRNAVSHAGAVASAGALGLLPCASALPCFWALLAVWEVMALDDA